MDRTQTLTPHMREVVAENMKERIYSSITLLAVMAALWQNADHHRSLGTIASILGAAVALWLATLIATRMSYRAVHGKSISRSAYAKTLFASSGLLAPAIPPILIIAISGVTGWYSLKTALMASMVIGLLSLFLLSFTAGRKIYDNIWRLLVVSALEMSVGIGVILLKLAVGE
jgi:TRAP-type C4-dicarboxylate transport system permease large subunit